RAAPRPLSTRPPPPLSTLFPYTTLFRSRRRPAVRDAAHVRLAVLRSGARRRPASVAAPVLDLRPSRGLHHLPAGDRLAGNDRPQDRKSTRLNSSHVKISYAVFCLNKKNK